MKPNPKQILVCNFCKGIIDTWIKTNDINSPTHFVDIEEIVNAEVFFSNLDESLSEELSDKLGDLLNVIRKYK